MTKKVVMQEEQKQMKLFEIPVYALSRDMLLRRYREKRMEIIKERDLIRVFDGDEHKINEKVGLFTYPQRLWDYNHIVGYITICVDSCDISFEQYVPTKPVERYRWSSYTRKVFLMNNMLNGFHFNYRNLNSGEEIQDKIHQMLDDITNRLNREKHYYVDREAFDQVDRLIDYSKLLEE